MAVKQPTARVWEDTIVLSLRDAQWLRCQELQSQHDSKSGDAAPRLRPQGLIKFDGRAESRLGDVAMGVGERYFIIEVKSTRQQIKDEWLKNGKFKPKKVYARLSGLANRYEGQDFASDRSFDALVLKSSFFGHFVAYWNSHDEGPSAGLPSSVQLIPYLQAMMESHDTNAPYEPGMIARLPVSSVGASRLQGDRVRRVTPLDLGRDDCFLTWTNEHGKELRSKGSIGLPAQAFQHYVNYLCQPVNDAQDGEPINAIMMSSHGSFFQVVSDTSELAIVLSEKFVQRPKIRPIPEPEKEREQDSDRDNDIA
jgi:hypothetical protein